MENTISGEDSDTNVVDPDKVIDKEDWTILEDDTYEAADSEQIRAIEKAEIERLNKKESYRAFGKEEA